MTNEPEHGPNSPSLSVLHVADSSSGGGAEKVFRQTVAATTRIGMSAATYVSDETRSAVGYIFARRHMKGLADEIERSKPDIVHLQNYYHYLSPSVLMAVRRARRRGWSGAAVYTAHDYHLVCPNSGFQRFAGSDPVNIPTRSTHLLRPWWKYDRRSWLHGYLKLIQHLVSYRFLKLHRELNLVISPSEFLARILRERSGLKVRVVRNPLDSNFATANCELERTTQTEPVNDAPVLIYAGRLAPEKGLREAIVALDRLVSEGELPRSMRLWVYGGGPEETNLRNLASSLDALTVHVGGSLPSEGIAERMNLATAFILPSRWYEVSPLSIVEAAARGLPVIVPQIGGLAETARLSERSYLYDLDDTTTLARAVRAAISDDHRNRLRDPEAFSMRTFAGELSDAYELAKEIAALGPQKGLR